MQPAAIFGLGPLELIIILVVIIVLFLPALLPKIARRAADTFKTIKDMTSHLDEDAEKNNEEEE